MKRIINLVLGFMLLGYLEGYSQCLSSNLTDNPFICGYYGDANGMPNWDWEFEPDASAPVADQTKFCKMWQARTQQGNGLTVMGSPFKNSQTIALDLISQAQDYKRAKGWELLQRNFGCNQETPYPYFILYNKYTALMRVFIYQPGIAPQYSSCLLVVEPIKAPYPATTGMGDAQVTALDKYRNSTSTSGFGRKLMSVTENSGSGNWRVAQFNMGFDPEIQSSIYSGTGFKVTINGVISSTVKAKIKGKSATSSDPLIYNYGFATNNEPVQENGQNKFKTTGEKFIKFSKTIDESRQGAYDAASKIVNSLANVPDDQSVLKRVKSIAEGVKNITNAASGIGKFVSVMGNALGTAGSVLNIIGGVVGLFSGGNDEPAALPSYSVYDMDLEGEITTNIVSYSFIVRMPGALQPDNNNATYYKCPLGIFSVKNTPQADLVTYERNTGGFPLSPKIKNFVSYRMRNNLEVTYNSGIGLDLVSVQAAIVGEVMADENKVAAYDLLADHTVYYGPYNLMLPDLEAGLLEVSRYDPDMKLHTFQTPYVNAECLAGLAFNARAETNVFLRVKAILKKRNDPDNTLIYFVRDYKIETVPGEFDDELRSRHKTFYARSTPVPYSNYPELHSWLEDKTINGVTYNSYAEEVTDRTITTENFVTVPAGQTVLFKTGSEIALEDGFEAEEGSEFTAALKISELNLPCGSPVRDAYAYSGNCYNTTASGLRTATDHKPENNKIVGEETIKVYPIPTNGKLFIEGVKANSKTTITILDQSGRSIKELRPASFDGGRIDVDVSSLSNGVYFVKIQTLDQIVTRKIVVTK